MKKILLGTILLLPLVALAQKEQKFTIKGKVENLARNIDWIYLQYRGGEDGLRTDSVKPVNGKYTFSGTIEEPVLSRLTVAYKEEANSSKTSGSANNATLYLQPGTIKVTAVDSFSNIKVKGSAAHKDFEKMMVQSKAFDESNKSMLPSRSELAAMLKDKESMAKAQEQMLAYMDKKKETVFGTFAKENPTSPVALFALQQYASPFIDAAKVGPIFEAFSDRIKNYPSAVEFKEKLRFAKITAIGETAMDFTQNDTLGNPVSLSSFRGRYVLVDFWASWCGPCRMENPNVVNVYNKYKDKNFHIVGVSLDRPGQKEKWMKAIHDDGLYWTQLSDLKFWNNEAAKLYGIKSIPQNLLIDPDGKIIAKNIRGDELDKTVGEAVKNYQPAVKQPMTKLDSLKNALSSGGNPFEILAKLKESLSAEQKEAIEKRTREMRERPVELHMQTVEIPGKTVTFLPLAHASTPEFYNKVKEAVIDYKSKGYRVYYEHVSNKGTKPKDRNAKDTIALKFRKMIGLEPTRETYSSLSKISSSIVAQPQYKEMGVTDSDINVDVSLGQMVEKFEQLFGEIQLTACDFEIKIGAKGYNCGKAPGNNRLVVVDFRNEYVTNYIKKSPDDKILVLFGADHIKGMVDLLQQ